METVNYVILTTGRSGSTLLCKLLNLNGIFEGDNDFNCETFHKSEDKINIGKETPRDYFERILEQYKVSYNNAKIRGIKVIYSQFNDLVNSIKKDKSYAQFKHEDIAKYLPQDTKYIIVKRRDVKKQAISYLKAVKGLGWEYGERSSGRMIISHPSEIDPIIDQLNHDKKMLRSFIRKNNIEPLYLTYEELCLNFESAVKDVLGFLNLPLPDVINIKTDSKTQYDKLNDQLLEEYELYRKIKRIKRNALCLLASSHSKCLRTVSGG